ncbi:cation:proton antiporter [Pyrinomonas methylaliphatogenes]|jgi:Kef-type K+ transport system membrane component KefB|uniref:Transporter, CPA2 family (TC 2.A.37) n=1 Tax=Pyrinomonas methylaliphatogenes TaxID=454194 RepID=A0A0B6WXI5_9BACT|nr:cation:proton antiporter [Pyrinomonas methylaliphatogenes]CDM64994.1 transporter, CPA2 family (TC 2.A.37) [Pyrinomonas methylaliphatogenes]
MFSVPLAASAETGALVTLLVTLVAAKLTAEIFERLRQPAVVGEILAGIIIGPSMLRLVAPSPLIDALAELGVIFLLFSVGLETKPSAIFGVGKRAALVATLGVIVPFIGGWALMRAWGGGDTSALFLGTAMVATSVGITARVLSLMNLLDTPVSRIILGAAVIDDILGLLVLAVVSSVAAGEIKILELGLTAFAAIAFTAFVAFVGAPALNRLTPRLARLRIEHSLFIASLIICLGLSAAAAKIGIAAIIGAFLAGMALAEAIEGAHDVHEQTRGVTEFFVPFFLVNIGLQLDLSVFNNARVIAFALLVTLLALLTKLVGCGAGAWGMGWRRIAQIGVGMAPRGEVGIVVALIGLQLGVIGQEVYGVVLFMSVVTTLVAPPLLKVLFATETAARANPAQEEALSR